MNDESGALGLTHFSINEVEPMAYQYKEHQQCPYIYEYTKTNRIKIQEEIGRSYRCAVRSITEDMTQETSDSRKRRIEQGKYRCVVDISIFHATRLREQQVVYETEQWCNRMDRKVEEGPKRYASVAHGWHEQHPKDDEGKHAVYSHNQREARVIARTHQLTIAQSSDGFCGEHDKEDNSQDIALRRVVKQYIGIKLAFKDTRKRKYPCNGKKQ